MQIGYGLVTKGKYQNIIHQLNEAGCRQIFTDDRHATNNAKTGFEQALTILKANDTLVIAQLNHLGKSVDSVIKNLGILLEKQVTLQILSKNLSIPLHKNPEISLVQSLVEFQSETFKSQSLARKATLSKRQKKSGRKTILNAEKINLIETLRTNKSYKVKDICRYADISEGTYYNYLRSQKNLLKQTT